MNNRRIVLQNKGVSIEWWEWDMNKYNYREFGKGLVFSSEELGEEIECALTISAVPIFQFY